MTEDDSGHPVKRMRLDKAASASDDGDHSFDEGTDEDSESKGSSSMQEEASAESKSPTHLHTPIKSEPVHPPSQPLILSTNFVPLHAGPNVSPAFPYVVSSFCEPLIVADDDMPYEYVPFDPYFQDSGFDTWEDNPNSAWFEACSSAEMKLDQPWTGGYLDQYFASRHCAEII